MLRWLRELFRRKPEPPTVPTMVVARDDYRNEELSEYEKLIDQAEKMPRPLAAEYARDDPRSLSVAEERARIISIIRKRGGYYPGYRLVNGVNRDPRLKGEDEE